MISIFTRNKYKDTQKNSSAYYYGGEVNTGTSSSNTTVITSGIENVVLSGDVTSTSQRNGNQLLLYTTVVGGGGGGTGEGLAFISTGWTTTQIEHLITDQDDPKTPVLMVQDTTVQGQDDYFWLDDAYVDANESWYTFRNGRGDTWKITSDSGDPDGTWRYHEGITANDNSNTTGYNFVAGTNVTINKVGNRITINSSGGGGQGATEIYWVNTLSDDKHSITIALGQSLIPVLRVNNKDYTYAWSDTSNNQNTIHYLVSEARDYWVVDSDGCTYKGSYDYPEIKWTNGGATNYYLPEYVTISGMTIGTAYPINKLGYGGAKFDNAMLNSRDIPAAYVSDMLEMINLPRDFVSGIRSGKYKGITIGQDHTYSYNYHNTGNTADMYVPQGKYTFVGSWTQTIQWTETVNSVTTSYSKTVYVIDMRDEAWDFNLDGNIHYDVYLFIDTTSNDVNVVVYNNVDYL